MSSTSLVTPAVSLSDLRGTQAADKLEKLKSTDPAIGQDPEVGPRV